jgi:hypothetical protein
MKTVWETNLEEKSLILNIENIRGGQNNYTLDFLLGIYKILHDNFGTGLMGEIEFFEQFSEMYLYIKEIKEATKETFLDSEFRWYVDMWSPRTRYDVPFYFKNDVDLFYAKILLSDIGE